MKRYAGVIPPVITPILDDETVDEKGFRQMISHCVQSGLHGIFVAGSNGETMALTQHERDRAIRIAIDEVAGRVPVLAGVMDSSSRRVIENIKRLEQLGGEVAVVTPVFYARHATPHETILHFEEIARHTSIKVMVYNIPPYTGTTLRAKTIFELARIDNVIGYKDTSGLFPDFLQCIERFRGSDFVLHQGLTSLAVPSLLMGADGFIPAMAAAWPWPYLQLYRYAYAGDLEKAAVFESINARISGTWGMTSSQTAATKYVVSRKLGYVSPRCCCPTEPITSAEQEAMDREIVEIDRMIAAAREQYPARPHDR